MQIYLSIFFFFYLNRILCLRTYNLSVNWYSKWLLNHDCIGYSLNSMSMNRYSVAYTNFPLVLDYFFWFNIFCRIWWQFIIAHRPKIREVIDELFIERVCLLYLNPNDYICFPVRHGVSCQRVAGERRVYTSVRECVLYSDHLYAAEGNQGTNKIKSTPTQSFTQHYIFSW